MRVTRGRLIQVVLLIGIICTLLWLEEETVDRMENELVQIVSKEQMKQEIPDNLKKIAETGHSPVSVKTWEIELPKMEWALFLDTEFAWGASGSIATRYAIYGDFTKTKKEAEDTYFALCGKILETAPELADYTDLEEQGKGYEYQTGWIEMMDEHISGCSADMEWIISWESSEFLSDWGIERWYHNGAQFKKSDSYIHQRNFALQQKDENSVPMETTIVVGGALEEIFGMSHYYYSRTLWATDSKGKVMAVANGISGEADAIYVYALETEKAVLAHKLPVPIDEAKWPLLVYQVEGNEQNGWVVFSYGYETFRITYPEGKTEKLGEYMFSASYSPDGKYLAYCTGNMDLFYHWENLTEEEYELYYRPMKEEWDTIPQGWYIIDVETKEKYYIPVPHWEWDTDRPLYGGRCTWIEKDKLLELLEME